MKRLSLLILNLFILYFIGYFALHTKTKIIEIEKPIYIEHISHIEISKPSIDQKLQKRAFLLLNDYIGKSEDCYAIAKSFIKELKGLEDIQAEQVDYAICGDLIFYQNNGYGLTHYAVYIDKDIALHGSLRNGKCYLSKVNMKNMSKPIFYRVKGKTK